MHEHVKLLSGEIFVSIQVDAITMEQFEENSSAYGDVASAAGEPDERCKLLEIRTASSAVTESRDHSPCRV